MPKKRYKTLFEILLNALYSLTLRLDHFIHYIPQKEYNLRIQRWRRQRWKLAKQSKSNDYLSFTIKRKQLKGREREREVGRAECEQQNKIKTMLMFCACVYCIVYVIHIRFSKSTLVNFGLFAHFIFIFFYLFSPHRLLLSHLNFFFRENQAKKNVEYTHTYSRALAYTFI